MEPLVSFQVRGRPIGKQTTGDRIIRNEATGRQFVRHYVKAETAQYMEAVGWRAREAMRGKEPFTGQLGLVINATLEVPRSWSKAKTAAALAHEIRPTSKPDFDNIAKMVDGMKGIVWVDDAQVVDARQLKWYGPIPFVQFEVFRP